MSTSQGPSGVRISSCDASSKGEEIEPVASPALCNVSGERAVSGLWWCSLDLKKGVKLIVKDRDCWPLACFIYFVLYVSLFIVLRKLQPGGVLFYQGLSLAFAVALLQIVIQKQSWKTTGAIKDALITFLLCFCFMFTVPTTVDRSYTIRMIMEIQSHQNGLSRYQIEQYFSHDFIEHGGIDKRLAEQTTTGSLIEREGRYHLTPFGQFLGKSFYWVQQVFSIRSNQPPPD